MDLFDYLTPAGAAKRLGVTPNRVRQFCTAGRLGVWHQGRWWIAPDDLERFRKIPRKVGQPPKRPH